jgi:hypothetical protein
MNPKSGCSTIKASLWQAADSLSGRNTYAGLPHEREEAPFLPLCAKQRDSRVNELRNAIFFSVVRNPYVRILSAYLDKIGREVSTWVWLSFAQRFGVNPEIGRSSLSFRDFLSMISGEPDELLNHHFRPQYLNILWPVPAPCCAVARELRGCGAPPVKPWRSHPTVFGARARGAGSS